LKDTSDLVWYVSYGSNLLAERFEVYLRGGTIEGRELGHEGARDKSAWRDTQALTLPYALFFAGQSKGWPGGGSAFVDVDSDDATALARGYLITVQQFQDVLAQESGRLVGTEVDIGVAIATGEATLGTGRYDRVLCPGSLAGYPMLTFTTPFIRAELVGNPPSAAYANAIEMGLVQAHGTTELAARSYLAESYLK